MTTSLEWIGKLRKKPRTTMSIEVARSIILLMQKKVTETVHGPVMPPTACDEVSETLKIGKQKLKLFWLEIRKALAEYKTLEEYWEDGRPFEYKPKSAKVKSGKQ